MRIGWGLVGPPRATRALRIACYEVISPLSSASSSVHTSAFSLLPLCDMSNFQLSGQKGWRDDLLRFILEIYALVVSQLKRLVLVLSPCPDRRTDGGPFG
jgi:hypothetical protein